MGSHVACPPIDRQALVEVRRMGRFITGQGFTVPDDGAVGDFAAPPDTLHIFATDRGAEALRNANLSNLRLTPFSDARIIASEEWFRRTPVA
jgi:hypothetical protein